MKRHMLICFFYIHVGVQEKGMKYSLRKKGKINFKSKQKKKGSQSSFGNEVVVYGMDSRIVKGPSYHMP